MDTRMKTHLLVRCFWFYLLFACLVKDGAECYQLKECVNCCPTMFTRTDPPKSLNIPANTLKKKITDIGYFQSFVLIFVPLQLYNTNGDQYVCFKSSTVTISQLIANFKEENVQQLDNMKITNLGSATPTLYCKNIKDNTHLIYLGTADERYFMAQKVTLDNLSLLLIVSNRRSHIFANGIFNPCEGGKTHLNHRILDTHFDFNAEVYIDSKGITKLRTFDELVFPFHSDWFYLFRDAVPSPLSVSYPWFFDKHMNLKSTDYTMYNPRFFFQNDKTSIGNPTLWMNFGITTRNRPTFISNVNAALFSCCKDFTAFSIKVDGDGDSSGFIKGMVKEIQWDNSKIIDDLSKIIINKKLTVIDMRGTFNKSLDLEDKIQKQSDIKDTISTLTQDYNDARVYIKLEGKVKAWDELIQTLPESEIVIQLINFKDLKIHWPHRSTLCRDMSSPTWGDWWKFTKRSLQKSNSGHSVRTIYTDHFCKGGNKFAPISMTAIISRDNYYGYVILNEVHILSHEDNELVHRFMKRISLKRLFSYLKDGNTIFS